MKGSHGSFSLQATVRISPRLRLYYITAYGAQLLIFTKSNFFLLTTHKMILLPYRFCGDSHHAFFLPLRLSYKERFFSKTYPSFLTVKEGFFRIPPSPFSQRELHFLPKPLFLRKRGCNRPLVLGTASLYGWRGIKALAKFCGMGPPGGGSLQFIVDNL